MRAEIQEMAQKNQKFEIDFSDLNNAFDSKVKALEESLKENAK